MPDVISILNYGEKQNKNIMKRTSVLSTEQLLKGRLSTVDLLIKIGCLVKEKNLVSVWKQLTPTS
jgi:hypothetical protein